MTHPLLAAILADPHDLDARRVYADWLEESGESDRAEFIRIQIAVETWANNSGEVVKGLSGKDAGATLAHYQHLLREHEYEWAGPVLSDAGWQANSTWVPDFEWDWRRGFVEFVSCTCADWLTHGPAVVAAQPITEVVLSDKSPAEGHTLGVPDSSFWCWYDEPGDGRPSGLPWVICAHLGTDFRLEFPSRKAAITALSRAALAWARREAGLPALLGKE